MASRFQDALAFVLNWEGRTDAEAPGDVDTSWGVTQLAYDEWRRATTLPLRDVDQGTPAEFEQVYRHGYWDRGGCEQMPWPLALLHFDTAVNCGVGMANRMLQAALGLTVIDGLIGGQTLKALREADPNQIFCRYVTQRLVHYAGLARRSTKAAGWLRGWLHRVGDLLRRS
jgi:lysozyme family protein